MAIVRIKPGYENIRLSRGNLVLKHYGAVTVLSRKPTFRNRKFTEAQKACQERFREAALVAKRLMADPRARAVYEGEARQKGKPARSLIIADYLHAPSVHEIDISSCKCVDDLRSDLDKRHSPTCAVAGPPHGVRRERQHVPNNDSAFTTRVWRLTRDELENRSAFFKLPVLILKLYRQLFCFYLKIMKFQCLIDYNSHFIIIPWFC